MLRLGWGILGLLVAGQVAAQTVPPSAEPGRIGERLERPPVPMSRPAVELPGPEAAPPPDQAASVAFDLSGIVIEGVTAYTDSALLPIYEALLGRRVTLADIYTVRDAITAKYRNDGFPLSQAIVPAQRIGDGVVKLRVVEGFIHEVRFEGDVPADARGLLAGYAERIVAARPTRMAELERYVLLIDDLPGVSARTVLAPAEGVTGGTVLTVILERKAIEGGVSLDNRGTREVGPYQIDTSLSLNDPTGNLEQIAFRWYTAPEPKELQLFDLALSVPIGGEGTLLSLGARHNFSYPGGALANLEMRSESTAGRLALSHPFIRTRSETLRGEAGLTVREAETTLSGQTFNEDSLRVLSLGGTYDFADSWAGANLLQVMLHQGLPVFGATRRDDPLASRAGGRSDFTRITAFASRVQPLIQDIAVAAAVDAQWSPHRLLSSEEFGVGGSQFGRAYDPSELTGDSGAAGRIELQYSPAPLHDWFGYHQLYGFWDIGAVWNHEPGPTHDRRSMASAGIGVRFNIADALNASFELAKPLTRVPADEGDHEWRPFFSINTGF